MESVFTGQLMSEMGKSIDGDDSKEAGPYSDFIQQAMTQGMTQGGGMGLAKVIENYHPPTATRRTRSICP